MNDLPKVVFSKTLESADWNAHGGASFVQELSRQGLVNEYRLVINRVALSNGLPLFKDLSEPIGLQLVQARTFANGSALHVYQPAA